MVLTWKQFTIEFSRSGKGMAKGNESQRENYWSVKNKNKLTFLLVASLVGFPFEISEESIIDCTFPVYFVNPCAKRVGELKKKQKLLLLYISVHSRPCASLDCNQIAFATHCYSVLSPNLIISLGYEPFHICTEGDFHPFRYSSFLSW